jgi:hypothetical protein
MVAVDMPCPACVQDPPVFKTRLCRQLSLHDKAIHPLRGDWNMIDADQPFPPISITSSELNMIRHVLYPYAQQVRRCAEPCGKRDAVLATIGELRQRIARVTRTTEKGTAYDFLVSHDERAAIDSALRDFVAGLLEDIPASEERDDLIRGVEAFRIYFMTGRLPPEASP